MSAQKAEAAVHEIVSRWRDLRSTGNQEEHERESKASKDGKDLLRRMEDGVNWWHFVLCVVLLSYC